MEKKHVCKYYGAWYALCQRNTVQRMSIVICCVLQQRDGKQSRALRAASAADGELCLEVKGWWLMHLLDRVPPGDGQVQVRDDPSVCTQEAAH